MRSSSIICCTLILIAMASCGRPDQPEAQKILAAEAITNDVDLMIRALSEGAQVNEEWMLNTPLGQAARQVNLEAARFLMSRGADINLRHGLPQRTPLHEASRDNWKWSDFL